MSEEILIFRPIVRGRLLCSRYFRYSSDLNRLRLVFLSVWNKNMDHYFTYKDCRNSNIIEIYCWRMPLEIKTFKIFRSFAFNKILWILLVTYVAVINDVIGTLNYHSMKSDVLVVFQHLESQGHWKINNLHYRINRCHSGLFQTTRC